jgi:hypothetical protein
MVKNMWYLVHVAQEETAQKQHNAPCMIYVEGTVTKVAGQRVGIYVYDKYARRIADLVGRRVKLIILDVAEE